MDTTFIQPEANFIQEAASSEIIDYVYSTPITDKITKGLKYGKTCKRFPVDENGKSVYKKSLSQKDISELDTKTVEYNTLEWCATEDTLARLKYPSVWKSFDLFTRRIINPAGDSTITIEEYQKITQTKSYAQALQVIEQAGNLLVGLRIKRIKESKDETSIEGFSILKKYKRKGNGVIFVRFESDFASYLLKNPPFPIPVALYRIDEKDSSIAYYLGRKIWEYAHIKREGSFTLSVNTLLEACSSMLPSEKDVKKTDRAYTKRIVRPLEKALEVIADKVKEFKWEYLGDRENGKRKILSREEVSDLNFSLWRTLYIGFTIKGYEKLLTKIKENKGKAVNNILPPVKK